MSAPLGEWAEQASCTSTPQAWWFPLSDVGLALDDVVPTDAAATCAACPVFDPCHRHALLHERYGVWAATSEVGRARLRRAAGIRLRNDDDVVRQERARLLAETGTPPPVDFSRARRDPPQRAPLPRRREWAVLVGGR